MPTARHCPKPCFIVLAAATLLACQIGAPRNATSQVTAGPTARGPATPRARQPFAVNSAGLSFAAPARPGGKVQLDESNLPFLLLFPELRDAPAPDWLQTGTRVTYRVQSATIPQAQDEKGAAAAGYVQYDVVALEQGLVVATSKLYLDATDGASVMPSLVFPVLGLPGLGEFWLNPEARASAEQVATDELAVTRMDKTIDGTVYHGVYFEYKHQDTRYVWLYDEASGVLLFSSYAIGSENDPARQLGQVMFAGQRQLNLPWRDGHAPGWVAQVHHLHFTGTFQTEVAGAPVPGIESYADVTLQDNFDHWSAYSLSAGLRGASPSTVVRLAGGDQVFDALWLAPEALEALENGQTLDSDPITGATITVSIGSRTVTLTETGQRYRSELTYSLTDGRLLETVQQQQIGLATTVTRLQLASSE